MRRGPGLAALSRTAQSSTSYASLGSDLSAASLAELRVQLDSFSSALRTFAARHRLDIERDASFRHSFQQMCAALGVDPLVASARGGGGGGVASRKGAALWEALGLGDWTYALGVQVVDVCVSSRQLNGGLIDVQDLCAAVTKLRTGGSAASAAAPGTTAPGAVTPDDIKRALVTLKPLGCGYELIKLGTRQYVRTLPSALDASTSVLLSLLSSPSSLLPRDEYTRLPYLTVEALVQPQPSLGKPERWTHERARVALDNATKDEGLLWVDEGVLPARYYSLATAGSEAFAAT